MQSLFLAPLTILLESNLALNFLFIFTAPVINAFAILTGQFYQKILGHNLNIKLNIRSSNITQSGYKSKAEINIGFYLPKTVFMKEINIFLVVLHNMI